MTNEEKILSLLESHSRILEAHSQTLPVLPRGMAWRLVLHTACPDPFAPDSPFDGQQLLIGARSAAVFLAERESPDTPH